MIVYIIFDDCPFEFGDREIIRVYSTHKRAFDWLRRKKKRDPYIAQYMVIRRMKVSI